MARSPTVGEQSVYSNYSPISVGMFTFMPTHHERQRWLELLSCTDPNDLADALAPYEVAALELRPAEVGLALVTGRVGATGEPFGLGEMTLTRTVVQIGEHVGVGYVRGRAPQHARRVAIADALLQGERHDELQLEVVEPLRALREQREAARAAEADTSRVQFLTMVRGN